MSAFYDDPRGVTARARMLNEVRSRLGHEQFTANSLLDLLDLLEQGAGNMVANDELTDEEMDRSVEATVELLTLASSIRANTGSLSFEETTIGATRGRMCPGFWPFC